MNWFTNLITEAETEAGIIKVDVNEVIAKVVSGVELLAHEADVLLKWALAQTSGIASALNAATPIISAVAGLATMAATGSPAAAKVVASAVADVDLAFEGAQKAVLAMQAASAAMSNSEAAGNNTLVTDTSAIAAGVQAIAGASASVSQITAAAVKAATAIQAVLPAPVPAAAPAPATAA